MDRKNALRRITQGLAGLTLAALAPAATAAPKVRPQKIVVHLSNSEGENALHAAMMGIGLATALRQMGAQVTLMMDASAPNFAKTTWSSKGVASAPAAVAPAMPPMSLGAVLAGFVKAGGHIRLCPHCSRMCGVMPGNVVPGAQLAREGELAQIVFDADKILDY